MKNTTNFEKLSLNEIIFIDRNKEYGAFELRETYNRRIKQSMMGALLLTVFACSYQSIYAMIHPVPAEIITQVHLQPKEIRNNNKVLEAERPKAPKPVQPPKPRGTTDPTIVKAANLTPTATANTLDTVPTLATLALAIPGDQNKAGTTTGPEGTRDGTDLTIKVKATAPAVGPGYVDVPEVMPEYPGGEAAMMAYVVKMLDYPDIDREMGNQGKVVVSFIVDEEGYVTNVSIAKGRTRSMDNEAMRVVSKLKKFKPGMQGGHPVRVHYMMPISYKLNN